MYHLPQSDGSKRWHQLSGGEKHQLIATKPSEISGVFNQCDWQPGDTGKLCVLGEGGQAEVGGSSPGPFFLESPLFGTVSESTGRTDEAGDDGE